MQSWKNNQIFNGISLQDSWILSWSISDDCVEFIIDFSLWPDSPYFEPPKKNEHTCYKIGKLIFVNPSHLIGLKNMEDIVSIIGPDGEKDFGSIDYFEIDNGNKFRMGWGKENINLIVDSINVVFT